MGEKTAVDVVAFVVLQKLEGLLGDESFAGNKIIGRRCKRTKKTLLKMGSSFTEAAEKERNDEEIKKLTQDYVGQLYNMEDSIEKSALGYARRRKKLGFLVNHALKMLNPGLRRSDLQFNSPSVSTRLRSSDLQSNSPSVPSLPTTPRSSDMQVNRSLWRRSTTSMLRERMEQGRLLYSYSYNEEQLSIVGHQRKVDGLGTRLRDKTGDWIIPLVGQLGSGKTMLARAIYGDRTIKKEFKAAVWVNVFKESKTTDILLDLLNKVNKTKVLEDGSREEQHLRWKLKQELRGRSYLVVLDGLEKLDQWKSLEDAFPEQHGSKIILTTCDKQVLEHDHPKWQPYVLKELNYKESWTLFMRKVGLKEDLVDPDLKNLILEGCQGLPLNIVLLGSLLSMKNKEQWPEMLNGHDTWQVSDCLELSYKDLDNPLKLCLIYMTLFPKELDISVRRLQRLWLAEGFVEHGKGELQDVAQKYFEDLVQRSLIMVSKQRSDGSPKKCRLLGAMHDLLLAKAHNISLFHRVHPEPELQGSSSLKRRLIEHAGAEPCALEPSQYTLLRSYITFNSQKKDTPAKYVSSLVSKMIGKGLGLLRVLDLEGVYKPSLPENLGDLFYLRYLGLRWTFLDKLPKSVGELPYLETLDLKHTNIDKIPTSIWKLKKLQHLNLNEVHLGKDTPLHNSTSLSQLSTLWGLYVTHESPIKNGLSKLKSLRELGITFRLIKRGDNTAGVCESTSPAQSTEALAEWIAELTNLQSLRLRSIDDTGSPVDLSLKPFSKLNNLSHLKLLGKLEQLPPAAGFPPQVKVLTLSLTNLKEDPMPILGKLPSLKVLRFLGDSYLGDKMVCESNTFQNLEVLKLWVLKNLKKLEVGECAMEKLKEVNIRHCCQLEELPEKVLQQKSFEELILNNMPPAFKEKIDKAYLFKVTTKDYETSES